MCKGAGGCEPKKKKKNITHNRHLENFQPCVVCFNRLYCVCRASLFVVSTSFHFICFADQSDHVFILKFNLLSSSTKRSFIFFKLLGVFFLLLFVSL